MTKKELPTSIDDASVYDTIHLSGYYRSLITKASLKATEEFIKKIK